MSSGEADSVASGSASVVSPSPAEVRLATYIAPAPREDIRGCPSVIAIAGTPGSGKTTLAGYLTRWLEWGVLSTGSIAKTVDRSSLVTGNLADEGLFKAGFALEMQRRGDAPLIIDGLPRLQVQLSYLPENYLLLALTCRPDIARERLLRRGRPDDTPEIIEKRIKQQEQDYEMERGTAGWLYQACGWGRTVNTTYKKPIDVARGVLDFLLGERREAF